MTDSLPFVLRWGDEHALARAGGDGASLVVLHEGADDRWLRLDAPERFAEWAARVASALPACRSWTTIDGLNDWPVRRYASGLRGLATGHLLRALDHQLAGHALAVAALPAGSSVDVGLVDHDPYELTQLLRDVLDAPVAGVDRGTIGDHLRDRRTQYECTHAAASPRRRLFRRLVASAVPLEHALPRSIAAVYELSARSPRHDAVSAPDLASGVIG